MQLGPLPRTSGIDGCGLCTCPWILLVMQSLRPHPHLCNQKHEGGALTSRTSGMGINFLQKPTLVGNCGLLEYSFSG